MTVGNLTWATELEEQLGNRTLPKPLSPPWDYVWVMVIYGVINGHVHLAEIEQEWREGTPYAYRGKRRLAPDVMGTDLR